MRTIMYVGEFLPRFVLSLVYGLERTRVGHVHRQTYIYPHPNDHAFASTFIILPYADEDPGEDLPDWNGDTIPLDFSPSTSPSSSHPNQVEDPADLVENPPDWVTLPATFLTLTLTLTLNQTFLKTTIITRLRIMIILSYVGHKIEKLLI